MWVSGHLEPKLLWYLGSKQVMAGAAMVYWTVLLMGWIWMHVNIRKHHGLLIFHGRNSYRLWWCFWKFFLQVMHVVGEWTDVLPYDISSNDKNGCTNTNLNECRKKQSTGQQNAQIHFIWYQIYNRYNIDIIIYWYHILY